MGKGKRYDGQEKPKLNIKKVISLIVAIIVIIMVITSLKNSLTNSEDTSTKQVNVEYFPVYTEGKWGVIDTNGDIVITPEYDEMIVVPNKEKAVFICTYDFDVNEETYKTKVLNANKEEILTGYDLVVPISNYDNTNTIWYETNILKVSKDGKYGIINYEGKDLVNCEYDSIEVLQGVKNNLLVKKDGKVGVLNGIGETIIKTEYLEILPLGKSAQYGYIVRNEDGYGIINANKKLIIEPQYKEIETVAGNNLYIVKDSDWKVVNKDNQTILSKGFDSISEIYGEDIVIEKDGKYGVINILGETLISTEYDYLSHATENYYVAEKEGKYGVIDTKETEKLPFNYSNIIYVSGVGIFEADNDNYQTEVYNKNFELKLTGIITELNEEDGYIRIREGNEYKYYNFKFEEKSNTEILKGKTLYLSKKDDKYGYVDKNGNVVVEHIYDDAKEQNEYGYCAVKVDNKWGTLDKKGKLILEPKYELTENIIIDFIGKWHLGIDLNMNYYTDLN